MLYGTVDAAGLAALRGDRRVAAVTGAPELSLIRPAAVRAATPSPGVTWGIAALGVEELWEKGFTGRGVRVAHLDTGVDGKHPTLRKAVAAFAQFDDFGAPIAPAPAPFDSGEHGTHTAATIAGRAAGGRSVGVAPGAELACALVIEGGDAVARVLGGLDWALTQGAKVLSMSLGFRGWWEDFLPVVRILRARNVLPVIAVGNEGPGTSRSPGNYAEAVSVGALDAQRKVASFSSSQRFARSKDPSVPDLVAPGVDVASARPGGGFQSMDGSSMAAPARGRAGRAPAPGPPRSHRRRRGDGHPPLLPGAEGRAPEPLRPRLPQRARRAAHPHRGDLLLGGRPPPEGAARARLAGPMRRSSPGRRFAMAPATSG